MALTEYSIVYTRTNQATAKSTQGKTVQMAKSNFVLSGNTSLNIGQITRILFTHKHSNGGYKGSWSTTGRLYFGDGTYITSNKIAQSYNGDQKWTTNTFSSGLPTPEKFATWTRMDLIPSNHGGDGTLQWWASSGQPVTITVYFYKYEDLIVDADPPTASGVTLTDNSGYSTTYGNPVQGHSNLTITGQYALDPRYPDLTSRHTLTLEDSTGNSVYSATQSNDAEFEVGTIDVSGTITLTYTVVDGTGGSATYTGTITMLAYSPPSITGLVVQRYTSEVDDSGTIYVASEDGNYVWFSYSAGVSPLGNHNSWSITLLATAEGATPGTPTTVETHAAGSEYTSTKTNDRNVLPAEVSAASAWTFVLTITDGIESTTATYEIEEAAAFYDVEPYGVSVGMRSTGTLNNKKFEVAEDYTSHFYGGIEGVTNYTEGEVATGGTWINGGKIYRAVFSGQLTAGGSRSIGILAHTPAAVLRIYGGFYYSMDGLWRGIPFISYADIGWGFSAVVAASSGSVSVYVGSKYSFTSPRYINYVLIVEYAANP